MKQHLTRNKKILQIRMERELIFQLKFICINNQSIMKLYLGYLFVDLYTYTRS